MCICSLSDAHGVNLLADGETLAFERTGLNVVYGKNGAGKTGYARRVKRAGELSAARRCSQNPARARRAAAERHDHGCDRCGRAPDTSRSRGPGAGSARPHLCC